MRLPLAISAFSLLVALPAWAPCQYQGHVLQSLEIAPNANGVSAGGVAGQVKVTYQIPNPRDGGFDTVFDYRAAWWPDWSGLPVILDSIERTNSHAYAISGSAVGGVRNNRATLWPTGAPDIYVDLGPPGSGESRVFAMDPTSQGGFAVVPAGMRPYLWYGSAASGVNLFPPGFSSSDSGQVTGTAPGVQVGTMFSRGGPRAYMWAGTAASGVDRTPVEALGAVFWATDGTQHVGHVVLNPLERERAAIWSTDGTSWTNIHPAGLFQSLALGCRNGKQVGFARYLFAPFEHARVWSGSAESSIDLHPFLPAQFIASVATGIDENGVICGYASTNGADRHAVVWVPGTTNSAPTANAGPDQEVVYAGSSTSVTLDGSGSGDPDAGDTLTYEWKEGSTVLGTGAHLTASFGFGAHTVTLTVTDNHGASSEDTMTLRVVFTWSGPLPPINPDGSSVFKLGSTVPVKFTLTGASAGAGDIGARLYIAKITNAILGTEEEAGSTSNADTGNTFRYNNGQFTFNLGTKGLSVGTWRLRVDLGDGVLRTVLISLK
jgi:hypothetical protein